MIKWWSEDRKQELSDKHDSMCLSVCATTRQQLSMVMLPFAFVCMGRILY